MILNQMVNTIFVALKEFGIKKILKIIMIFGIYVIFNGHLSPGGGFSGGGYSGGGGGGGGGGAW